MDSSDELERCIQRIVDEKFTRRRRPRVSKQRRRLTLADVAAMESGPELTPYDMERISAGQFSDETVRRDIQRGVIVARVERRGVMTIQWIAFSEAKRYLAGRGLLQAV